jgi:hypothetical protein
VVVHFCLPDEQLRGIMQFLMNGFKAHSAANILDLFELIWSSQLDNDFMKILRCGHDELKDTVSSSSAHGFWIGLATTVRHIESDTLQIILKSDNLGSEAQRQNDFQMTNSSKID